MSANALASVVRTRPGRSILPPPRRSSAFSRRSSKSPRCVGPSAQTSDGARHPGASLPFQLTMKPLRGSRSHGERSNGRKPRQSHSPVPHVGRSGSAPCARTGISPDSWKPISRSETKYQFSPPG
jgi:hypothetical protein